MNDKTARLTTKMVIQMIGKSVKPREQYEIIKYNGSEVSYKNVIHQYRKSQYTVRGPRDTLAQLPERGNHLH